MELDEIAREWTEEVLPDGYDLPREDYASAVAAYAALYEFFRAHDDEQGMKWMDEFFEKSARYVDAVAGVARCVRINKFRCDDIETLQSRVENADWNRRSAHDSLIITWKVIGRHILRQEYDCASLPVQPKFSYDSRVVWADMNDPYGPDRDFIGQLAGDLVMGTYFARLRDSGHDHENI